MEECSVNKNDFVYMQIYKGAMKAGASEYSSHRAAVTGIEDYKKNKFKKAIDLIEQKIKEAKKGY